MRRQFSRSLATLPEVMKEVSSYCKAQGAAGGSEFAITFAVEEIFTNMVKYNPEGPPEVSLSLEREGAHVVVTLEDEQEHEFDPTHSPDPAVEKAVTERRAGGLGLFLVRKMIERVDYRRSAKRSTVILSHPLES